MLQGLKAPLIILSLALLANSATDVTLLNCPSQYNLTQANVTSETTASLVSYFYTGFSSQTSIDRVETIVVTGDTEDLNNYINQLMTPYIILACIIFPIYVVIIFYCMFDKSWPPCQRFRRNPIQQPYSKRQRRCMVAWLLIFAAGIFTTGIVSFTSIPAMKNEIDYTKCSMYNLLDISLNGDTQQSTGWGGFRSLKNKIGNISSLLDSASTQVQTYFTNDDWLVTDMTVMKNINMQIYEMNKDAQLITPDPQTTQQNLDGGYDYPVIDSVFITSGLGPNGTFNTMVDDIDRGLRVTQAKSNIAYDIYISANNMVEAQETIQQNAIAAQNTLAMYIRQLEVINQQMDAFSKTYFDDNFSYGVYILQGVIGFVLVSSLLILIGGISTHFYQIFECRYMVHCGWCIYGLMYFGVLVCAFVTLSLGTVSFQFCQYFHSILDEQSDYYRFGDHYSQNALNRIDVCIFEDGDALSKFQIDDQMKTVTDVFTNIQTYYDYDNPSSTNYIDLDISLSRVQGWISAIENYRLGIYIDSLEAQTNDENPNYAIQSLNQYTNPDGLNGCTKDRWVYDKVNCTDPNQIIYTATADDANGMALSNDTVTCISFNQKFTTSMSGSWSQSDFSRRYVQIREQCPQMYESIVRYGYTIINYRDSRINLYQGIKDDLQELYNLNSDFNDVMESFRSRVDQFYQSVATLNNLITNQLDGLLVTSDCRTIKYSMQVTYNVFCVNFMGEIVKIGICVLVLLICLLAAMLTGSIFGVRYANIQLVKRITGEHEQINQSSSSSYNQKTRGLQKDILESEHSHSSEDQKQYEKQMKL